MGLYDVVMVKCPSCNKEHFFQSKSGNCILNVYPLEDCPEDVLEDVNRHAPVLCECKCLFQVDRIKRRSEIINYNKT